jgi:hypothetical protein
LPAATSPALAFTRDDIAARTRAAGQNFPGNRGVGAFVSTCQCAARRHSHPEIVRVHGATLNPAIADFENQGRPSGGDLIQTVGAVDHETVRQTERS